MINDASFRVWQQFFDDLMPTPHERRRRDRQQLGKRVRLIAIDLELSGNDADARVLMEAAGALIGDENE